MENIQELCEYILKNNIETLDGTINCGKINCYKCPFSVWNNGRILSCGYLTREELIEIANNYLENNKDDNITNNKLNEIKEDNLYNNYGVIEGILYNIEVYKEDSVIIEDTGYILSYRNRDIVFKGIKGLYQFKYNVGEYDIILYPSRITKDKYNKKVDNYLNKNRG